MTRHARFTIALIFLIVVVVVAVAVTQVITRKNSTTPTSTTSSVKKSSPTWHTYTAKYTKLTLRLPTTWQISESPGGSATNAAQYSPPMLFINSPDSQTSLQIADGDRLTPDAPAISGTVVGSEPTKVLGQMAYWTYQLANVQTESGKDTGTTTVNAFIMANPNSTGPLLLSPDQTTTLSGRKSYIDISIQNLNAKSTIAQLKSQPDFATAQKIVESLALQQ